MKTIITAVMAVLLSVSYVFASTEATTTTTTEKKEDHKEEAATTESK